jgi:hypothetical protein
MIPISNSSAAKTKGNRQMFKIISKNRANNTSRVIKNEGKVVTFTSREAADKFAVRLTMAESNPKVTYTAATAVYA